MTWIAVLGIGYFLGAIPFGVLVGKLWKKDIRQHGSGNVGFTNAWRVLGIGPASLVLIGDFSKGFLAAYIGSLLQNETGALLGGMIAHHWSHTELFYPLQRRQGHCHRSWRFIFPIAGCFLDLCGHSGCFDLRD